MVKRFVSIFMVAIVLSMFCFSVIAEGPSSEAEVASSTSEDEEEIIGVGVINANNVILREGPTRETAKIASFSQGTKVNFIVGSEVENQDEYGTRIKVRVGELEGYVAKKYIFETEEDGEWYLLSTSTTKAGANTNRDININIASSYINGKILQPNEKFSFWDTVGKCTYDKGYKDATVYNNGKKTKGIGGGVCQVSTTVNMAVKSAGIKTNARQHSLPVSYASREDEATVSFGNIDFKFTNTTGKTIMLVMGAVDGSCTCEVWAKYEQRSLTRAGEIINFSCLINFCEKI